MEYLIIIEKGTKNYSAYSPDVLGCIATGKTIEKTISEMKEALEFHLEDAENLPEAKGLKYHLDNGLELSKDDLVTNAKVEINEKV